MNPLTHEWIAKAEADLLTARREFRARKAPNYDAVCFHAQQAAEKYLKAVLQDRGMMIPRTHSLLELVALVSKNEASFLFIQSDANALEGFAVQFRYPGITADRSEAKLALDAAHRLCGFIRLKFGE